MDAKKNLEKEEIGNNWACSICEEPESYDRKDPFPLCNCVGGRDE